MLPRGWGGGKSSHTLIILIYKLTILILAAMIIVNRKEVPIINSYSVPDKCPVCGHELLINKLSCSHCATKIEGEFSTCKFCRLPDEQREFIEVFIKCRGSIKEVERELGISYPTVRSRLDSVIAALGHRVVDRGEGETVQARDILDALEEGKISAAEAARRLKKGDS